MTDIVHANPYLLEIHQTLPRLLASYDRDPVSPTLGIGDRLFWGWKTRDFANATPQGAVNGLAQLVAADLLPAGIASGSVVERIDEMIMATRTITARDGSLVEAMPNEKSFCVTALIAFDILSAVEHLTGQVTTDQLAAWRETAAPLIEFIVRNDETHAIISNHLATAVAALLSWQGPGNAEAERRATHLLDIIFEHQSPEGWYSEYGSVDPGYDTLGIYYLSNAHVRRPDLGLQGSLSRSLEFLTHFAHPDGSFGGIYGARNTRFIVPAGLETMAPVVPAASALAQFARSSIAGQHVVTLISIDDSNLAPNFNAYCQAACRYEENRKKEEDAPKLPHQASTPWRRHFKLARLVIDNDVDHYTIIAPAKGGVVMHCRKDGTPGRVDAGSCGQAQGRYYTTQAFRPYNEYSINEDHLVVTAPFVETVSERPSPLKFLVLRAMALSIFRFRPLTEMIKRLLVKRLVTRQKLLGPVNRRTIKFGPKIEISDEVIPKGRLQIVLLSRPFLAIHMASAGYWQKSDDEE